MILETSQLNQLTVARITCQDGNMSNADQFKEELYALIDKGTRCIAVDFSNVGYVDSSFLGALVSSLKYALGKGSDIVLTNLQDDIDNLLQLIRMDKVFKIYKNALDAANAL